MRELKNITPMDQDFSKWYQDVVVKGNLIEYGPTQGSMIYKPIAYGIWENITKLLNKEFKKIGVDNVYLPLLIPLDLINKEKSHIKGFAPELATITKVGDKELKEQLVIRPTSEVLFGGLFSKIIRSYKDLPIKYNQWANVLRWEKKTNPFLRNREFLWQEGHTVHSNAVEARKLTRKMIKIYSKFLETQLAIPTIIGKKTSREKFAGAVTTYTVEAMMKDGKALQCGTSHYLGQNFSKAFNISFINKENKEEYAYQTSWGISTRLIGGLIMTHGDNRGIIIPPNIAPYQIDILELFGDKEPKVKEVAKLLQKTLGRRIRVRLDSSSKGPGFKAGKSEIEGTPLRIEVGPRDLENDSVMLIRRDTLEKTLVKISDVKAESLELLKSIQNNLLLEARKRLEEKTVMVKSYDEFKESIKDKKFVKFAFAGDSKDEEKIQEETGATARCIPINNKEQACDCIITKKETKRWTIFARAY